MRTTRARRRAGAQRPAHARRLRLLVVVPLALAARRDAYCIIEGKGASDGRAAGGRPWHVAARQEDACRVCRAYADKPDKRGSVARCRSVPGRAVRSGASGASAPTAATLFPSMRQLGRRAPPRAPAARPHRAPSASCCRPPAAAGPCSSSSARRRRASWPRCRAGRACARGGRSSPSAARRAGRRRCPASRCAGRARLARARPLLVDRARRDLLGARLRRAALLHGVLDRLVLALALGALLHSAGRHRYASPSASYSRR